MTLSAELRFDPHALAAAFASLGLRSIVLFGSFARGEPPPGPESDIDLAIACDRARARPSIWDLQREFDHIFPDRSVDIVFLADADPLFRWEIVAEGVLLAGDPLAFLEYRAFAFRDFQDSADLRALERILFEKRMAFIRQRLHAAA
jgi:predicted nucleotidyltransferase